MTNTQAPAGSSLTAVRTYKGAKATVTVYDGAGAVLDWAGGKRAERAQAALITRWADQSGPGIYGLRADLSAAHTEAHRLVNNTTMKTRGGSVIPLNCPAWAIAVPVVDA